MKCRAGRLVVLASAIVLGFISYYTWFAPSGALTDAGQYPGHKPLTCLVKPRTAYTSDDYQYGVDAAKRALEIAFGQRGGIWDTYHLEKNPMLNKAIEEFIKGERAASIRELVLENKTPEEIHNLLKSAGFSHERKALFAGKNMGVVTYWRHDGTKTNDPSDPEAVPMDIYIHEDGGMVRIKPFGVPNPSGKAPRRQPHLSKAVLLDLTPQKKAGRLTYDLSFRNEAFKVSATNIPIPKTPAIYGGMYKPPFKNKQRLNGYISYLMGVAHQDLPFPLLCD